MFGVYVHLPFCRLRCDFCAFATYTDRDHLMDEYAAACVTELVRARAEEGLPSATSVYFGGGTPSRLPAETLLRVLDAVQRVNGAEVTVECNPEDATPELLAAYRAGGVTRLSLGVQSRAPHVLTALGRHGSQYTPEAMAAVAAAGFASWNVDLMFGGPGESEADWEETLEEVVGRPFSPPHVSAYALTVEAGTALARDPARHPDEDGQARRYRRAEQLLTAAAYEWEEISNWARPGHGCRHNTLYWSQGDYRGIGAAAHSHRSGHRWWNARSPDRYIARLRSGRTAVAGEEVLGPSQRRFEAAVLALRTSSGVAAELLPDDPDLTGLVERTAGRAVLTLRGRLLADQVAARLLIEPVRPGPGAVGRTPAGTIPPRA